MDPLEKSEIIEAFQQLHPTQPVYEALLRYGLDKTYQMVQECQNTGARFKWIISTGVIDGCSVVLESSNNQKIR